MQCISFYIVDMPDRDGRGEEVALVHLIPAHDREGGVRQRDRQTDERRETQTDRQRNR